MLRSRRPQPTRSLSSARTLPLASALLVVSLAFTAVAQETTDPFLRPELPALDARYETILRELASSPSGLAFLDALLLIDREYLYGVDRDALLRGATAGLIAALDDPYSRYLTPDEVAERRDGTRPEASVTTAMLGDVGYVGIKSFETDGVGAAVGRAIDAHLAGGARALVLDLRGNVGGSILQGLQVLDRFLADGVLGFRRVRGVSVPIAYANPRAVSLPLVVLVDDATASTAEIVAGALQAYERARLVGTVTAGKGIGQTAIELTDGAEIQLVSFEWLLPGFRSIDGSGLRPDVEVAERRDADAVEGYDVQGTSDVANDPSLRAALLLLRETIGDELAVPLTVPVPTPGVGPTVLPAEPNDAPEGAPSDADDDPGDDPGDDQVHGQGGDAEGGDDPPDDPADGPDEDREDDGEPANEAA